MVSLTREQVRAIDKHAQAVLGVPTIVLMENAGRAAVDAIERHFGRSAGRRFAVVAGAGNNGGDGFVMARHLAMRGAVVTTFLLAGAAEAGGDAGTNLAILRNLQHDIRDAAGPALSSLGKQLGEYEYVIDAIGGTGITGPLRQGAAAAVEQVNASGLPVIAVDIPTGLDCDNGTTAGPCVRAAFTVTMAAMKQGFLAPSARQYTGEVVVVDIGIPVTAG
jgi:hydroxyethylthiazole kinase-like uncharacterized protein yjeF